MLLAKRAFVAVLRALALAYGLVPAVTRDSTDEDVSRESNRVNRKVHPDKGGAVADSQTGACRHSRHAPCSFQASFQGPCAADLQIAESTAGCSGLR